MTQNFKRKISNLSITKKIWVIILSLLFSFVILLIFSTSNFIIGLKSDLERRKVLSINSVEKALQFYKKQLINTAKMIAQSSILKKNIPLKPINGKKQEQLIKSLHHLQKKSNIAYSWIIHHSGKIIARGHAPFNNKIIDASHSHLFKYSMQGDSVYTISENGENRLMLKVATPIDNKDKFLGVFVTGKNLDPYFAATIKNISGVDILFLLNNKILSTSFGLPKDFSKKTFLKKEITSANINHIDYDIYHTNIWNYGYLKNFSIAIAINNSQIKQSLNLTIVFMIILFLVLVSISYFLSSFVAENIIISIQSILKGTKKISRKDFSYQIEVKTNDELGILAKTFNEMSMRIQDYSNEIKQNEKKLLKLNEDLEQRVTQRTTQLEESNFSLSQSLEMIKKTQHQLVESEKMAALGGLVAGIAHEINTPIGIGVTAASFLEKKAKELKQILENKEVSKETIQDFVKNFVESSQMVLYNLSRASEVISSFKQVAVDQTNEDLRFFCLMEYLNEVLLSLNPKLKKLKHEIKLNCPKDLKILNFPGAISQIISNLIFNSTLHAFEEKQKGMMTIDIKEKNETININYHDNGVGIKKEVINKIFDPFYTTKRGQGGTGLGLHIVYNLVKHKLKGNIHCISETGTGTTFKIEIPKNFKK